MDVMERSEREALIIERRNQRVPFRKIAEELGITHARVQKIFQETRDRIPAARLADLREEESELADRGIASLLDIAENERISPRTRVEAWNSIRAWSESKRKLYGVDAPIRKEITVLTEDVVDAALRKASEEHEAKARELEMLEKRAKNAIAELEPLVDA